MSSLPDPTALERPWIGNYPPGVPPTYDLPEVALCRFMDDAARDFPDRDALVTPRLTVDHVTLRAHVDAIATVLVELGVHAGDRVLLALPNHHVAPMTLLAVWRVGGVAVPVPVGRPVEDLQAIVTDAEVAAVVAEPGTLDDLAGQDLLPALAVQVDGDELLSRRRLPRLRRPRRTRVREGAVTLADRLEGLGGRRARFDGRSPEEVALLAYRAGADEPRGTVLTHANLVANAFQARLWVPDIQAGRERLLVADPLHELAAITLGLLTGLLAAATVILLDEPDPGELAKAIERERPTLLHTSPARLAALAHDNAAARHELSSLRVCVTGKEPLAPDVADEIERLTGGARVREGFGLLEAGPLTHAQPVYGKAVPESMGLPVTGTVAIVVDPDDLGAIRPVGRPGLLLVAGPQVAAGYWRRGDETAATFVDGWLVTGDVVSVTEDGVFHHVGRVDEVVHRGGEVVAPQAIERVLERHPGVRRVAVGVLDGQQLVALVTRRRRRSGPTVDDLLAHCRVHLDPAAVPDRIELVDELPLTASGVVARDELHHQLTGR